MRLPLMNISIPKSSSITDTIRGLNQNLICSESEWSAMKNVSDRFYPAIASRPDRAESTVSLTDPKCLIIKNGIFYIDGTAAYYKGVKKFTVTDTDKQAVGMGAYVCVFPDGVIYNTFTDSRDDMTAAYTQSGTITFAPLSKKSAYTRITASGITKAFSKGDNVRISGLKSSSDIASMFNDTVKVITDVGTDSIIVTGALTDTYTFSTSDGTVTFKRDMPADLDFVAERDNRIWACSSKNHEIYCCKLGDPKNWYNYETEADNAWAATVGSDGDFTACTKYSSYMLFFKENTVHILRGDKPSNFSLTEKELPGVRKGCSRSVVNINDVLYYVGTDGVYSYNGAIPQKVSAAITQEITDAVGGKYEGKYYLSCKLDGVQTMLVYDTKYGIWDVEDDTEFKYTAISGNSLYYIGGDNKLYESIYGGRSEEIEWFLESGDIQGGSMDEKYVSKIKLNLWCALKTELTVYLKCDDEPMWHKKGWIRSTRNKTYTLPIIPQRCSKYRLRIEGKGHFKLLALSKELEQGSEMNGSIWRQHSR